MKKGKDVSARFRGLYVVHQNVPEKQVKGLCFPEHILFLPLRGEISVQALGREWKASPGEMLYLPGGTEHGFRAAKQGGERLIAMLEPRTLAGKRGAAVLPASHLAKELLFFLLLHPQTKHAVSLAKVFAETLGEVLDEAPQAGGLDQRQGQVSDPRVREVLELLKGAAFGRLSLPAVAKKAGLSPRNLQRLVFQETGLQPRQWAMRFRVERAEELLRKPGASVTDVALAVGYNSLGQFISAFRAQTGQLPSDYLRR